MKWLIVKRSRTTGALDPLAKRRAKLAQEMERLAAQAEDLEKDLAAVDRTLSLHEIQIRPESIAPVTPQVRGGMLVLRGMGREILRTLRQSGDEWRSTSDLVACMEATVASVELTPDMHKCVRVAVRRRLRNLLLAGTLERKLPLTSEGKPDGHTESLWRLVRRRIQLQLARARPSFARK